MKLNLVQKSALAVFAFVMAVGIAGVCFIHFNTSAAAEFTDNVLRPVFGADAVVFVEKIFFNASDKLQQLTSKPEAVQAPQFNDDSSNNQQETDLDLTPATTLDGLKPLKNEGIWKTISLKSFPEKAVLARTFVRPDKDPPYAVVVLVELDMKKLDLGIVAGTKEPGGKVGNPGPGIVPHDIVESNRLVAAFDGGFQYRDGAYGMIANGKTYLPLENDLGTLVGYKDGRISIIDYTGQDLGKDVAFVRQNCPILLENGQLGVENEKNKKLWGRTLTTGIFTWRTGVGINKKGNLVFAVGNSLTPTTLATALKMGGAENAIQLDINPNWVRFNIFNTIGDGKYLSQPLTKDLKDGAPSYLNGYSKDFFYVYKKS